MRGMELGEGGVMAVLVGLTWMVIGALVGYEWFMKGGLIIASGGLVLVAMSENDGTNGDNSGGNEKEYKYTVEDMEEKYDDEE